MKLCTSIGTRLGAQVRDFPACFGYFTKWDRNYFEISWHHFEFSILFTRGINGGYFMAAQRHEISLRVLKNISRVSAPLISNCLMMNLKLQNAERRRFVFAECYVVKLLLCVVWPLRFWIIYEWLNRGSICRDPEYDVVGRSRNAVATSVPQL